MDLPQHADGVVRGFPPLYRQLGHEIVRAGLFAQVHGPGHLPTLLVLVSPAKAVLQGPVFVDPSQPAVALFCVTQNRNP